MQLAEQADVSREQVGKVLNGRVPLTPDMEARLLKALAVLERAEMGEGPLVESPPATSEARADVITFRFKKGGDFEATIEAPTSKRVELREEVENFLRMMGQID